MNQSVTFNTTFKLDKTHFHECFEQSAPPVKSKDYVRAVILGVMGIGLFFVEAEHYYIPFFLFCLFVVELLSVKYRKTWWVWRQLMSKAANAPVKLMIDNNGITTETKHANSYIDWNDVNSIEQTNKGILIRHKVGVNYISNSHLSGEILEYIVKKIE